MGSPHPRGAQTLTCKVNGNHRILYINVRVNCSSVSQIVVSVCPVRARRHSSLRHTAAQRRIKRPCLMLMACVLSIGYTSITNLPQKKKSLPFKTLTIYEFAWRVHECSLLSSFNREFEIFQNVTERTARDPCFNSRGD